VWREREDVITNVMTDRDSHNEPAHPDRRSEFNGKVSEGVESPRRMARRTRTSSNVSLLVAPVRNSV